MVIKNIFNIKNYKGLPDGIKINFEDTTYIVGDNAKNKSTIGGLPAWIFTGYNLTGSNKEQVANDNIFGARNTTASMTIIDNSGTEHTITRCKGKDNFVMLDEIRTTQEVLTRYYGEVHAFLCSYYPGYFRSMKLMEQKELLLRILPAISAKEAFDLLADEERETLEKPVVDIQSFCKARRSEIKELESDLDKLSGSRNILIQTAIQKEDSTKIFENQEKLNTLEQEYENLIQDTDNILNLEDLEKSISKLGEKINNNINTELKDLQTRQKKELDNLENVSNTTSKCPTCKQEIKNENLISVLKITYKKNVNTIADKIDNLKKQTKELMEKRKKQMEEYEIMRTPEMQEKTKKRDELKEQIEGLRKDKQEIDLFNKEVEIKHNDIIQAKKKIEEFNQLSEELANKINKYNKQIKIATKLRLLMIEKQMKDVRKYLKNVTIDLYEIDNDTGEMNEVYEIKYKGRKYEKLSKSYKIRADIELATFINKVTKINTMMFIDDVESITQIATDSDVQTILAIVIKYNDLEILYDYSDVLLRERDSINKKIAESSEIFQNAA